jgi:DNA-binding transcriptional regulator YhcF (GntR family)
MLVILVGTMSNNDSNRDRVATPIQTVGTILRVIRGLYAYKKPATSKNLAAKMGLNYTEVGKTFSDAKSLGLAKPGKKRGTHVLTQTGEELVRLLEHGKEEESRTFLANLISSSPEWSEVMLFLAENHECGWNINDLVLRVEHQHKRRWSSDRRRKAAVAYKSILRYAGLIEIEGDALVSRVLPDSRQSSLKNQEKGSEVLQKIQVMSVSKPPAMLSSAEASVDYACLNVPDSFIILVRKSPLAIDHLRRQVTADSYLQSWFEKIEKDLVPEEGGSK